MITDSPPPSYNTYSKKEEKTVLIMWFQICKQKNTGKNGASSHKTNYIDIFPEILNLEGRQKIYWFKSYGDFAEWVDFAYWWSCIRKGLRMQPAQLAYFCANKCT